MKKADPLIEVYEKLWWIGFTATMFAVLIGVVFLVCVVIAARIFVKAHRAAYERPKPPPLPNFDVDERIQAP